MQTDKLILDLAAGQGGVIRKDQALERGMTVGKIRKRVHSGQWQSLARSVYRIFDMTDSVNRIRAAIAGLPDAVVSHESAAEMLSIPLVRRGLAVVTVHSQTTHSFPGVTIHRCHDLDPCHIATIDNLPVTTAARTIVDLAALLHPRHLAAILDDLLASKQLTVPEVQEVASAVSRRGKPGSASLRTVLAERADSPNENASRLELLGFEVLRSSQLPDPMIEYPIPWAEDRRFDAAYPHAKLAIEWDSRRWHTQVEAFERDRRRDRLATLHGWRLVRFTWDDLTTRPAEVAETVRRLLAK
ncbi:MAG: hypothetical protein GWP04_10105 [Gammaproteobacteria bacterium]|nr:hypothetical protein [Gammaproteobacteria bacterium]